MVDQEERCAQRNGEGWRTCSLAGEILANVCAQAFYDLDAMDWLNVIVGFHPRFGVDIPEADYARLISLDTITSCLVAKRA